MINNGVLIQLVFLAFFESWLWLCICCIKTNNIAVRTVSEGAALMEGYVPPPSNGTNTPPVIAPHLNVEANATSSVGVLVSYTLPLVSDDHDTNLVATCAPTSGSLFVLGTTTVTCNTKDSSGSVAIPRAFVVHVTLTATSSNAIPPPAPVSSGGGSGSGGGGGGGGSFSTYWGCTNQAAKNYNRLANKDDGTCILTATTTTVSGTNTSTTTGSPLSSLFTSTNLGTSEHEKVEKEKGKGEVLGAKIYKFKHKMKMGSRGEEVGELQKYLFSRGFYFGPFTSYFGKLTQAAIKSFQKASQLEAVGYIGPKTLSLLNSVTFAKVLTTTPNSLSIDSAPTKQNNKK